MTRKFSYKTVIEALSKHTSTLRREGVEAIWLNMNTSDWGDTPYDIFIKTQNLGVDEMRHHVKVTGWTGEPLRSEAIFEEDTTSDLYRHMEMSPTIEKIVRTIFDVEGIKIPERIELQFSLLNYEHSSQGQVWPISDLIAPLQIKVDKLNKQIESLRRLEWT